MIKLVESQPEPEPEPEPEQELPDFPGEFYELINVVDWDSTTNTTFTKPNETNDSNYDSHYGSSIAIDGDYAVIASDGDDNGYSPVEA